MLQCAHVVTSSMVRLHCQSDPNIGSWIKRGIPMAIVVPAATRTAAVEHSIHCQLPLHCASLQWKRARYAQGYVPLVAYRRWRILPVCRTSAVVHRHDRTAACNSSLTKASHSNIWHVT